MMSGCRIAPQTVGFYSKVKFTSYSGASSNSNLRRRKRLIRRNSLWIAAERGKGTPMTAFPLFVSCLHSGSPGESPVLSNSSSQKEDDDELSLEGLSSVAGGIVALGKFDALHIGHRELAVQASKVGTPYLLSFVGMAEVLGWEPRAPVVAACDRKRVLSSWAPYCCDVIPQEIFMEFSTVRHLTPRQFVEKLAKEVGVGGIVAGENYRFGYRASGDTSDLLRLCDEYGIGAYIIGSVMDHNQKLENSFPKGTKERGQVSSTRVRYALAEGDVNYVRELLGRRHRVILSFENKETIIRMGHDFSAPKSCLLNLPPKDGHYNACSLVIGNEISLPCKVTLDSKYFHLDFDRFGDFFHLTKSVQLAGIEFGSSEL